MLSRASPCPPHHLFRRLSVSSDSNVALGAVAGGLITYRDTALLYDPLESSAENKQVQLNLIRLDAFL